MKNLELQKKYKKSWIIMTKIARDLICSEIGSQMRTVNEYSKAFESSRGIIQDALKILKDEKAFAVEKRGNTGSYISSLNIEKLFEFAAIEYIMGSMPPPLKTYLSALATGVCGSMSSCTKAFNFAFIHSSRNRTNALMHNACDFIIVSLYSAKKLIERFNDLELALVLNDSLYSPPFCLYTNLPNTKEIEPESTIAADPNSDDQYDMTLSLCASNTDKKMQLIPVSYIASTSMFHSGEIDYVISREHDFPKDKLTSGLTKQDPEMMIPAIVVLQSNYNIARILRKYIIPETVAQIQNDVIDGKLEPDFY